MNIWIIISIDKDKNASDTHYTKQCMQVIITYQSCCEQKSFHILGCYGNFDNFIVFLLKTSIKGNWWFGNKKIGLHIFANGTFIFRIKETLVMTRQFYGVCVMVYPWIKQTV